jgi:hypothetical protein
MLFHKSFKIYAPLFLFFICTPLYCEPTEDSVVDSAYGSSADFVYASGSGHTCDEAISESLIHFKEKTVAHLSKCEEQGGSPEMYDIHSAEECLYVGESQTPYLYTRWGHVSCSK